MPLESLQRQSWALDFVQADKSGQGVGGFVRLELRPDLGAAWYWAYLVGPEVGLIVVRDHEATLPRPTASPVVRAEGLWAEFVCETDGEHWSVGLEAFGVRLDDPADGFRGEIGERLAVGLDLEWEIDEHGGAVYGEILLGRDRLAFDGVGWFTHEPGEHSWATTAGIEASFDADGLPRSVTARVRGEAEAVEILGVTAIPIDGSQSGAGAGSPRLVRVLGRWTHDDGATKVGWIDLVEWR